MTIVETKTKFRSNVEQQFQYEKTTDLPEAIRVRNFISSLKGTGNYSSEYSYPDTTSNLAIRETSTFASLDIFSQVDTAKDIAFDQEFLNHYAEVNLDHPPESMIGNVGYQLTGIDDPFHVTTVYRFPVENDAYIPVMEQSLNIAYDHKGKLADMIVTSNSITVVHQYNNGEDFVGTHFKDLLAYVPSLSTKNATRTITYTSGTYTK